MNLPAIHDADAPKLLTPMQTCLISIYSAMKADYGAAFNSRFKTPEIWREFKRRVYVRVQGKNEHDVADGYEEWVCSERGKKYLPTLPELMECIEQCEKRRIKKLSDEAEADRISALPSPTMQVNPLKMLAEAKENAGISSTSMIERLAAHNALITIHLGRGLIRQPDFSERAHGCAISSCRKLGSLSSSTSGSESWYCQEHYRIHS